MRALLNDLNTISKSNDMEKAEETYKDQLVNLKEHFRRKCSKTFNNPEILSNELSEINSLEIDFNRIEIKEMIQNKKTALFPEQQQACRSLLTMIEMRRQYLFPEHADCNYYLISNKIIEKNY